MDLTLVLLEPTFTIAKLPADAEIPVWAVSDTLCCITRTPDELSIVCDDANIPNDVLADRDWRAFQIEGELAFSTVGITSSITTPLAEAGIYLFSISTYDTDYILVGEENVEQAKVVLAKHFTVR